MNLKILQINELIYEKEAKLILKNKESVLLNSLKGKRDIIAHRY